MHLINTNRRAASALLDRIAEHVPGDEPAGEPTIFENGRIMITATDERFAVETDTQTGRTFVTRIRVVEPGTSELTIWEGGQELARRTQPIADVTG